MAFKVVYIFKVLIWAYFFSVAAGGGCIIQGDVIDCGTSSCCISGDWYGCCDDKPIETPRPPQYVTTSSYPTYSSTTRPSSTTHTLSKWGIIGIVAGCAVLIIIISAIAITWLKRQRPSQNDARKNHPENGAYHNSASGQNGALKTSGMKPGVMNTSGMQPGVMYPPRPQPHSGQVNAGYASAGYQP